MLLRNIAPVLLASLILTGCDTPPKAEALAVAASEAVAAKDAADAGSTVGVANAIGSSKTVKSATAALKGDSTDIAAKVSEVASDVTVQETAGALAEVGAKLAGSDDPSQYGTYVKAGAGVLALLAAGVAWLRRKKA
jgi:hypothetical protein